MGRQAAQLHRPLQGIKASGADMVYLGGIYDNNGGQLIKDKVAVLGKNDGASSSSARTASPATRTC